MAKKTRARRRARQAARRSLWRWLWALLFVGVVVLAGYVGYLDYRITAQFEGKRWALPAHVYARPLELYPGMALEPARLTEELEALKYHSVPSPSSPASYSFGRDVVQIVTRPFMFWDKNEPSQNFRLRFDQNRVADIVDEASGTPLSLVRLDPALIGGIYPSHNEDRVLVKYDEVPQLLIKSLIVIEDRHFNGHIGVDPRAITRAMLANVKARDIVQGGSTLTQQLVKNYFLTSDQTLSRKLNEAIMALLLEWHYDKKEILESYLNEVYLGQDTHRAIHGFGLASHFYFEKPLEKLEPHEVALLVALVKGPSYYDPRRHGDRALTRRNVVLEVMAEQGVISEAERMRARARPLGVSASARSGITTFPAFLDLVRRDLRRDYREADLTSEGLRIFTTLDPRVQRVVEAKVVQHIEKLERQRGLAAKTLETAVIVTTTDDGEILAIVGGRDPRYAGFNRALDGVRQVGSLIKPAVYLTALHKGTGYTLATLLDDQPMLVEAAPDQMWRPRNYDGIFRGSVPLHVALAQSYNVPTARLGMAIGVDKVVATLHRLGIDRDIKAYPSLLLGANVLTPIEVAQMYQTFAARGFRAPLRAVRAVMLPDGTPVKRYALTVEQAFEPEPVYLVNSMLNEVVRNGTGMALSWMLPEGLVTAGKTGTTDDYRDSWFAGFSDNRLAVVWVGNDENRPVGLTGASGALPLWGDIMRNIDAEPFDLTPPEGIERVPIDSASGLRGGFGCDNVVELPFIAGTAPQTLAPCADGDVTRSLDRTINFLKGVFE